MADNTFTFRLQDDKEQHDLSNSIKHWGISSMYGDKQIAAIKSSNKNSLHQPTSIPSPFARIALVKTAFAEVAEYNENALASYQKIVSDSLDVAEIFFTLDKWKDKIEVIKWDKAADLNKLKEGHRQLYKTLNTFLQNDSIEYNFDRMQGIYILKYKPTGEMIGATSPSTIFFSSGNDLSLEKYKIDIQLPNNHKAFNGLKPLWERSWEFQKYLHIWVAAHNENRNIDGRAATSIFQEISKYLKKQEELSGRIQEIADLKVNASQKLSELFDVLRAPDVEVLGKSIYKSKSVTTVREYLTEKDLFEDTIIRVPYIIRSESFFDGNIQKGCKFSYLLPIRDEFFKHFNTANLKSFLKINEAGNVVNVVLTIDNRSFSRLYSLANGTIIVPQYTFDCAIFPNVKFENENLAHYRFGLVCNFKEKDKFKAEYVKINSPINSNQVRSSARNETRDNNFQLKNYSLEGSNFDYIRINYGALSGLLIPDLKPMTGNDVFTFAVDFGTTNTHIEYKINDVPQTQTFDILKEPIDEKQVHWLHGQEDYLKEVFDAEYISANTNDEFNFPMRTALSFGENTNWNNVYPFEKASLNELYEKRIDYPYNKTKTDLKWSDDTDYSNQVKVYIESIMYLLRNKVVIGNGRLDSTKIIWFYPVSMERQRFNNLTQVWINAYKKYFGENAKNIFSITESVAPFEFYVRDRDANNLVTIDIGGGTTDIVISCTGEVYYITSFRFAADSIFGDGYGENNRVKNGIARQFISQIKTELQTVINPENYLFQIFDSIYNDRSSADIASFLFSLKQNKKVRAAGTNLAENVHLGKKLVEDTSQKITFIFFYSAIIYHLAKLMKAKNLGMPDKLVFSGNGSRVIRFFTDDETLLKGYTKLIFEKIYDKSYSQKNIEIIINHDNPKEATCKGGFYVNQPATFDEILRKKVVLHCNGTDAVIHRVNDNINAISDSDKYISVNEEYLDKTVVESEKFIKFVFDLLPFFNNRGFQLNNDSVELAKKVCFQRLQIHAKNGWKRKSQEITNDEIIEETLFFYPLVGMLKELADAICDKKPTKAR